MIRTKSFCSAVFLLILLTANLNLSAQKLRIAVAANAHGLIKKLQADFKKRTGIETEAIIGASGKLTAQIMNGAPYEVFLSADTAFPERLFNSGLGLAKPKIYAMGSLIICGSALADFKDWQTLLSTGKVRKLAIANPKTAPYGKAAEESLKFYKLDTKIKSKLVYGESIAQVNTYIQTDVVDLGFTTESILYEKSDKAKLKWARVDDKSYGKIEQAVILLSYAKKSKNSNARKFYDYLSSASAKKIIAGNGYHLPK